jgi:hypothetical protein
MNLTDLNITNKKIKLQSLQTNLINLDLTENFLDKYKTIPNNLFFFKTTNQQTFTKTNNEVNLYSFASNLFIKNNQNNFKVINHSDFGDETRILKKSTGKSMPIRCIKFPIQDNNSQNELIRFRFNSHDSTLKHKPLSNTTYLTLKQKRYNVRNKINPIKFNSTVDGKKYQYSGNPFLKEVSIIEENFSNPTKQYGMVKKSRNRLETSSINT